MGKLGTSQMIYVVTLYQNMKRYSENDLFEHWMLVSNPLGQPIYKTIYIKYFKHPPPNLIITYVI